MYDSSVNHSSNVLSKSQFITRFLDKQQATLRSIILPFVVTTDASDFDVGAVLEQDKGKGLQPIAYFSKKLLPAETRYSVHEIELLAIVCALQHWRHFLYRRQFTIYSDHKALIHWKTQPKLNNRQVRWSELLADYNYTIVYKPGKDNQVADCLSRNPAHALNNNVTTVSTDDIPGQIKAAASSDTEYMELMSGQRRKDGMHVKDGLLYLHDRLVIPNSATALQTQILSELHETKTAGHCGVAKTIDLVTRSFYWRNISASVTEFVSSCISCQRSKASNQQPAGLLHPLPIPEERFSTVTMDFIGPLQLTKGGHNMIITVVDKLSKRVYFIPSNTNATAARVASLFFDHVVRFQGLPTTIISDRDTRFTSIFWKALWAQLGTTLRFSTAFHPQTDGQTERMNRVVEDIYLRAFVSFKQDNWDQYLTTAELAYNNSKHASTGFSPFFLTYGQHPRLPVTAAIDTTSEPAENMLEKLYTAIDTAHSNLKQAQQSQKHYADQHRRDISYSIGDRVLLKTDNLRSDHPAPKLAPKYIGPFVITAKINDVAYALQLPDNMRFHNKFHISKLKPYIESDSFPTRTQQPDTQPPPHLLEDGESAWEVEEILRKRMRTYGRGRPRAQYLTKWKGYSHENNTWEPKSSFRLCPEIIEDFEQQSAA